MSQITAILTSGMAVQLSNGWLDWTVDDPNKGFIDKIISHVQIEGDFDDAQRKRLAEIVERCPVHKTLANGVAFSDNATFS